ncbi:MAG: hypothetical protein LBC44_05065 [Mycoplasmataceae bacterium]|jgi:hypothetical protein|nr:hypothetical protein [Mycoplasmataceae bacterium]
MMCGVKDPCFNALWEENKIYKSWVELLTEYKIDNIPLKDMLCSDEVDMDSWCQ